ncbi:hypothetical protein [Deinococcus sp. YIM 134068]|uniref:hypothetical protein n=1 Tax=Deinococcus lichenicola TaxID=3118910 RepID=UPI002F929920
MTAATPLVLTPRQVAERLGVGLPTLRRHAATWEELTGEALPRGEHLERLWPESVVLTLSEALSMVHRQEAPSVVEALRALTLPQAPPLAPLPTSAEALRALIREEVRAALREELAISTVAALPRSGDELRGLVRDELRVALDPGRLRVLAHAAVSQEPARPGGWRALLITLLGG